MLLIAEIFYESPVDYKTICSVLESAIEKLSKKHLFNCSIVFHRIKIFEGQQRALLRVVTTNDRVFALAKDFIYWAFEDVKRLYGFDVYFAIEHTVIDLPEDLKGQGEEGKNETTEGISGYDSGAAAGRAGRAGEPENRGADCAGK